MMPTMDDNGSDPMHSALLVCCSGLGGFTIVPGRPQDKRTAVVARV
jgi:hypothetical protein